MSMKKAALEYAARGWPVFPCKFNKDPYTEHGVLEATTDPEVIEDWWDEYPKANIGMDVGSAGMMVIDLDPGHDWDELEANIGELPDTQLVQNTPRGGEHLFYALKPGELIPLSSSKLANHVDVRSHHSYVLLAPSRTADGKYSWESEGKPAFRSKAMAEKAGEVVDRSEDHDNWIIEQDLPENEALAIDYLKNKAQVGIEGRNGDEMTYKTAAMCKSFGISPENAFDLMWKYWNPRCLPPFAAEEADYIQRKIENAYYYNTSPPGNMTPAYKVAKQQALFTPVVQETVEGDPDSGREAKAGRFRFVDEHGVDNIKPPEWLIDNVLPKNSYALLIGQRGTFKTFVALDMALSIACGGAAYYDHPDDWLGCFGGISNAAPVLFAAGEGRAGFRSRVNAWKSYHIEGGYTDNFFLVDPVPHPTPDDVTAFIEGAKALSDSYALVVLDTVGRSMQGLNENSQQDASLFTQMVEAIQKELDCAVLAIHHTGHEAKDRARGSSVFGADVDTEFVVELAQPNLVRLKMTKQKDAEPWENAMLVSTIKHQNSLVAARPTKAKITETTEADERKNNRGRKTKHELGIELAIIRQIAYATMKKYPGKEWSKSALANAIAADEKCSIAVSTVRQNYLEQLLTDKKHPVAHCYDVGKGVYVYRK